MVDNRLQHRMEGSKQGILLRVGHVLFTAHRHGEAGAVHDELVFTTIGRDTDVVGLADRQRASSDDIGLDGFLMTGLCNGLCLGAQGQHAE